MERIRDKDVIRGYLDDEGYRECFSGDLDEYAYAVKADANEAIINQGDRGTTLYYLMEGRCRIRSINQEGHVFIIDTVSAPGLLGEIELISGDDSFSVETIEDCILIALPFDLCRERLLKDSRFLLYLCESLTDKERMHALQLSQLASYPLINRLAAFILDNASRGKLSLKKTVIAESLGVSYRHLEKVMKDLVEEGILDKEGKVYTIIDRKRLEDKAAVLDLL